MPKKKTMTADRDFCHKCNTETAWKPAGRTDSYLKCEGCGDRFPCAKARGCNHLDCAMEHANG